MPEYQYPNDGKLHTRYSELVRCTPAQLERVIEERHGLAGRFENKTMKLGTIRHRQWQRESDQTGFLPICFKECLPNKKNLKVTGSEIQLENEILPGVILHSTIDAYLAGDYVADFKTTSQDEKVWGSSKQLLVYAYQLFLKSITVKRAFFFLEHWDEKRENILGYDKNEKKIANWKMDEVKTWLDDRVFALQEGIRLFKEQNNDMAMGNDMVGDYYE